MKKIIYFLLLVFCIFSIIPVFAEEESVLKVDLSTLKLDKNEDYIFSSFNLTDIYQINNTAKQIQKRKYEQAEKSIYWVPTVEKQRGEYYLCLGEIELHKGNIDLANVYLTKALDILLNHSIFRYNNQFLAYNELAKICLINGNYQKALDYSDKAMEAKTLEKEFIVTRIKILKKYQNPNPKSIIKNDMFIEDIPELENHYDTATDWEDVLKTLTLCDSIENIEYTWGEIFGFTKKQRKSYAEKQRILDKLPLLYIFKTALSYTLGYTSDALSQTQNMLSYAIKSNNKEYCSQAYWVYAMILIEYKNYQGSIDALTKALEYDPTNYLYYLQRSWVYIKNKQSDFALADVDKCIELDPNKSVAYEYKANYLEHLGKRIEALQLYKKALEINPNSKNALENIKRMQGNNQQEHNNWFEKRPTESWLYYYHRTGQSPFAF